MYNCIFTGHCIDYDECNTSCPVLAQTSYLLERNEISMSSSVFKMTGAQIEKYNRILTDSTGKVTSLVVSNGDFTNEAADMLTYCGICQNWRGSQLHCTVYNLKFNKYIEVLQRSWSFDDDAEELSQVKIWATNAKVLIVSSIEFINFKDFQSQALLSIVQSRLGTDRTTIVVTPPITSLVGTGQFFAKLTSVLAKQKVGEIL